MATRAPLPIAQFAVGMLVDRNRQDAEPSWRALFAAEDAAGIWRHLSILLGGEESGEAVDPNRRTQDLFLELITTDRPKFYLEAGFSQEMIEDDLRLLCARRQ